MSAMDVAELDTLEELHALLEQNPDKVLVVEFSDKAEPILPTVVSLETLFKSKDFPLLLAHVHITRHNGDFRRAFRFLHMPRWVFIREGMVLKGLHTTEAKKVPSTLEQIHLDPDVGAPSYPVPLEVPRYKGCWGLEIWSTEAELLSGRYYCYCKGGIVSALFYALVVFVVLAVVSHLRE